jgi:hypothetical protein
MSDWLEVALLVYLGVGVGWLLIWVTNYLDLDNEQHRPQIARFVLATPIWPVVAAWYLAWGVGLLFGRLVRDATRKVER